MDPYDYLAKLLDSHLKLLATEDKYSVYRTRRCPPNLPSNIQAVKAVLHNMKSKWTNNTQLNHALIDAIAWCETLPKTLSEEDRFICHHLLLDVLDDHYADRRPYISLHSEPILVLGRRWWSRPEGLHDDHSADRAHTPTSRLLFPRLRIVNQKEAEGWFDDQQVGSAFSKLFNYKTKEECICLRIGLCSFLGDVKLAITGTGLIDDGIQKKWGFKSIALRKDGYIGKPPDPTYINQLKEALDWARDHHIHILLMPELSVCPDGLGVLAAGIRENPGDLCLIIPGSFHVPSHADGGSLANSAPIWLVTSSGKLLTDHIPSYEKHEIFDYSTEIALKSEGSCETAKLAISCGCRILVEDIKPGNSFRLVMTRMGIWGIAICKDALFGTDFYKRYCEIADHMLVVSMNPSDDWFRHYARECAHFGCSTFYVNAAQAIPKEKSNRVEAALWHTPDPIHNEFTDLRSMIFVLDNPKKGHHKIDHGRTVAGPFKIPRKSLFGE
jgi:hypothetical protein